jgi:hypothetical protein
MTRVEYSVLSFGGCCEDCHVEDAGRIAERHKRYIDLADRSSVTGDRLPITDKQEVRTHSIRMKLPFRAQGILTWECSPDSEITSIKVGDNEQLISTVPAFLFNSPFTLEEVFMYCAGGILSGVCQSKALPHIYMETLQAGKFLSMTTTGHIYDLLFWGVRQVDG